MLDWQQISYGKTKYEIKMAQEEKQKPLWLHSGKFAEKNIQYMLKKETDLYARILPKTFKALHSLPGI